MITSIITSSCTIVNRPKSIGRDDYVDSRNFGNGVMLVVDNMGVPNSSRKCSVICIVGLKVAFYIEPLLRRIVNVMATFRRISMLQLHIQCL